MDNNGGNVLKIIAHDTLKRKSTRGINPKKIISWKKGRPTKPKRASGKTLDL